MSLATTTLSVAVGLTDKQIVVASATSLAAGRYLLVDQEMMRVAQDYVSGTTANVLRGQDGTVTAAHKITANVTHGFAIDFAAAAPQTSTTYPLQRAVQLVSVTATSTLALPSPGTDMRVVLNGTTIITLTIPVPTKDMDGTELTIVSNGAAAHVPTFTGGLGGSGAGYTAFTFNASKPVALKVIACNGVWVALTGPAWSGTVTNLVGSIA